MSVAVDFYGGRRRAQQLARQRIAEARRTVLADVAEVLDGKWDTPPASPPQRLHPALYRLCLAGREPAESLPTAERSALVAELHGLRWTDQEIADHTRMTLYTTARIRARLGLSPSGEAGT